MHRKTETKKNKLFELFALSYQFSQDWTLKPVLLVSFFYKLQDFFSVFRCWVDVWTDTNIIDWKLLEIFFPSGINFQDIQTLSQLVFLHFFRNEIICEQELIYCFQKMWWHNMLLLRILKFFSRYYQTAIKLRQLFYFAHLFHKKDISKLFSTQLLHENYAIWETSHFNEFWELSKLRRKMSSCKLC